MDTELVHRAVCLHVYAPSFVGTYCAYPRRDGQDELTWLEPTYNLSASVSEQIFGLRSV